MKISCTKGEKKVLTMILRNEANFCPFEKLKDNYCGGKCEECIEKNIEWQIEDGDGE